MIFVDIYYMEFVRIIFILCIDEEGEYEPNLLDGWIGEMFFV